MQVYLQRVVPAAPPTTYPVNVLIAAVANSSDYTITRVEAMFSPDGQSLVGAARTELVPAPESPFQVGPASQRIATVFLEAALSASALTRSRRSPCTTRSRLCDGPTDGANDGTAAKER